MASTASRDYVATVMVRVRMPFKADGPADRRSELAAAVDAAAKNRKAGQPKADDHDRIVLSVQSDEEKAAKAAMKYANGDLLKKITGSLDGEVVDSLVETVERGEP